MSERKLISGLTFDKERALYALVSTDVERCVFAGPADGESAFKECRDISVRHCSFSLRYPFWHDIDYRLFGVSMDEKTRAPLWYSKNGFLEDCTVRGVKCLRECDDTVIKDCDVISPEFGWRCRGVKIEQSRIEGEYFLFESRNVEIDKLKMKGKYSFQYVENMIIDNSELDTKDAFWHSKNVTVKNSTVKGEYLGWYSEGLTLVNCHIIGTQPLCYCKDLTLINCTTELCDLSFEYSDVQADIKGDIVSIKNPRSGRISVDSCGEIILENSVFENNCEIKVAESIK